MKVYSQPPEGAFGHVFEIWDQELNLGNAVKTVQSYFPDTDVVRMDLQNRIWEMRRGGDPMSFDEIGEFFRTHEASVLTGPGPGAPEIAEVPPWKSPYEVDPTLEEPKMVDPDSVGVDPGLEPEVEGLFDAEIEGKFAEADTFLDEPKMTSFLEPEAIEATRITIPGIEGEVRVLGMPEEFYLKNAAIVNESIAAAVEDGTIMSWLKKPIVGEYTMLNFGGFVGGLAVGAGVGALLSAAIHND